MTGNVLCVSLLELFPMLREPSPYVPGPFLLTHFQHAVEGDACPTLDGGFDLDAVDDAAFDEVFKSPGEVVGADAVHSRTEAAGVVEGDDALALSREALGHAVDEMNFSPDGEH